MPSCTFLFLGPKNRWKGHLRAPESDEIRYHGTTAHGSDQLNGVNLSRIYKTTQE
jgi:hypothetical protein